MSPKRKGVSVKNNMDTPPAKKIKGSEAGNFVSLDPNDYDDYDAWYRSVESVDWSKYHIPVFKLTQEEYDEIMAEIRQEMEAEKISDISVKHGQKQFD